MKRKGAGKETERGKALLARMLMLMMMRQRGRHDDDDDDDKIAIVAVLSPISHKRLHQG